MRDALKHLNTINVARDVSDARIRRVMTFVERNLSRRITLSDAARLALLERHYFSTLFRRSTQRTFNVWVRERRVLRAVFMLSRTSRSIHSIALDVGYSDWTGLERAFRAVLDGNPRQIRQMLRGMTAPVRVLDPDLVPDGFFGNEPSHQLNTIPAERNIIRDE